MLFFSSLPHKEGDINAFAWHPNNANHICTVGNNGQALIWEISNLDDSRDS